MQINDLGTGTGGDVKLPVQSLTSAKATREGFFFFLHWAAPPASTYLDDLFLFFSKSALRLSLLWGRQTLQGPGDDYDCSPSGAERDVTETNCALCSHSHPGSWCRRFPSGHRFSSSFCDGSWRHPQSPSQPSEEGTNEVTKNAKISFKHCKM